MFATWLLCALRQPPTRAVTLGISDRPAILLPCCSSAAVAQRGEERSAGRRLAVRSIKATPMAHQQLKATQGFQARPIHPVLEHHNRQRRSGVNACTYIHFNCTHTIEIFF